MPVDLTDFKANWTQFPESFDLNGRVLDNAQFTHASLIKANLGNTKCASKAPVDFSNAELRDATLTGTVLPGAIFNGAVLSGANMATSNLFGAKFLGAYLNTTAASRVTNLSDCNLRDADFSNAHLDGSNGRPGANLTKVRLWGDNAKIANATLAGAVFTGSYLGSLDLRNIKGEAMRGVQFTDACLVNCKFNGSALIDCFLNNACLYGADFSDAELYGATFNNAWVSTEDREQTLKLIGMPTLPSVTYKRTVINGDKTNSATTCADSTSGPCKTDASWRRAGALPTEWQYKGPVFGDERVE
ncbi:MAG TPA: pentapeptide repeat-containing protein [Rudaea sp.]|nr:pentapeptide repeat-containing protein [Rudaea sp.]